ncbi:hypothetical protein [Krasilnikovia sp. MM14-A1004]|uniref:hypothetical protein n=1 Tax=Krasilnikovia sp. MM14-A1004 TaxID=3373541 RepID=UPI00399D49BA
MALINARRHPVRLAVVLALLAVAATVLFVAVRGGSAQAPASSGAALSLRWAAEPGELEIVAVGYRPREFAQVRVGSAAWRRVRADGTGTVRLSVPVDGASAGTTVVVDGRAVAGGSRSLAGGVPPVVAARGPADAVPWVVSVVLVLIALGAAFSGRRPAGAGTRGEAGNPAAGLALPRRAHPGAHRRGVGGPGDTRPVGALTAL